MNGPKGPLRHYLEAGTVIGDRYEIRRRLGSGGIGDVYKATDTHLGNRTVALKMLSTTVVAGPLADEVRGRFILEAQALSAVRDDHVVSVLNFGFADEGVPYLVMEFLEGQDLESLLKESGGSLSIPRAVDIALDVCGGVYICHIEEIVHRDLKPANIFLEKTPRGERAKVVDFGISKSAASAKLSRPGIAMGTPKYMAPEQLARGQTDARSDQYSIGLILYRCLTGRLPDKGGGPNARDLRPEVRESLNEAVMRALAPDPDGRFPSVYEFGRQLMLLASEPAAARWREFYRTPPQPKWTERSQSLPLLFMKPGGRFDPSTLRVSYDAATRLGGIDDGSSATSIDLQTFTGDDDAIPEPIPVPEGGTALDEREEAPLAAATPPPSKLPFLAPSATVGPVANQELAKRQPKLKAMVFMLGLVLASGAAALLYGRRAPTEGPTARESAVTAAPSTQARTPAASPPEAPSAPPPIPPLPVEAPPAAAPVAEPPGIAATTKERRRSKKTLTRAGTASAAPEAGMRVRYTGDQDPILE